MIDPTELPVDIAIARVALRIEHARRAMHWADEDRLALQRVLQAFGEATYLRTILQEIERSDIPLTPALVQQVRAGWSARAQDRARDLASHHATSIVRTHNTLVDRAIATTLEANPSFSGKQLVTSLRRQELRLADWKTRQINETFRYASYQAAFEDFYRHNPELGALFNFGGSLQCPVCQEIAAGNPYTLAGMQEVDDPPHPGCLDIFEPAA